MSGRIANALMRVAVWWRNDDPVERRIGHRITQPGNRRKAVAYWHRCAQTWLAGRFERELIDEGRQPARRHGPRAVA